MGRADAFMPFQIRTFKSKARSGNPAFPYWLHFPQQSDGAMAHQAASKGCYVKPFLYQACPPCPLLGSAQKGPQEWWDPPVPAKPAARTSPGHLAQGNTFLCAQVSTYRSSKPGAAVSPLPLGKAGRSWRVGKRRIEARTGFQHCSHLTSDWLVFFTNYWENCLNLLCNYNSEALTCCHVSAAVPKQAVQ